MFQCTKNECEHIFIGQYESSKIVGGIIYQLQKTTPKKHMPPFIEDEILKISPLFSKIFEQASAAEGYGLDEVSGVGYRKALEFLVKDYCVHKNPSDEQKIKSSLLGVVIENYVGDQNIKACAKRATWLGNDETHYVKKWESKDISDLKILITLTCGWIKNHVLTEKYMQEMN